MNSSIIESIYFSFSWKKHVF